MSTDPTVSIDAARVIAGYQQALADATHRAILAESALEQLRAGGAS